MLPILVRKLLFPLHESLLHRPTFPFLKDIEQSQWFNRNAVEELQARHLMQLLQIAERHCPWHARRIHAAGIDTGNASGCLEQLRHLPTMDKTDAQAHMHEMVWKDVPGGTFLYNTGGSSGTPLIFYFGRARQASDAASRMRARRWWGVDVGEREVLLWGSPVELGNTDYIKTQRDRLFNQLVLNAFAMSPQHMDDYLVSMRRFRPSCVYGYASSLALLAAHARSRGENIRIPGLRVVCCTGEPLYPEQQKLIESVYGVPTASEYGSRDAGFIAHQSPSGQLLVNSESVILELLDPAGNPVEHGALGEVVITGLCSQAQPFIRYRTGDMARASFEPCAEGRGLHVLAEVAGRQTDFVVSEGGAIMHALAVIYILRAVEGVGEFKIIQYDVRDLQVLIVANSSWRKEGERQIQEGIRARLGLQVAVRVELCDAIEAEPSGKHRYVVSHVPLPDELRLVHCFLWAAADLLKAKQPTSERSII